MDGTTETAPSGEPASDTGTGEPGGATPTDLRHPIVARLWDRMSRTAEMKQGLGDLRAEALAGISGRVVEVGCGNGMNFGHYPSGVVEVLAVEPEPYLRAKAVEAAPHAPVPVTVVAGTADALPAGDGEFDAAVASLVLCTVGSVTATLAEVRRVLRPGGRLHFFEHVRDESPAFARFQRAWDVVWVRASGWGCHAARDTVSAIEGNGFEIESIRRFRHDGGLFEKALSPHVIGVAAKR